MYQSGLVVELFRQTAKDPNKWEPVEVKEQNKKRTARLFDGDKFILKCRSRHYAPIYAYVDAFPAITDTKDRSNRFYEVTVFDRWVTLQNYDEQKNQWVPFVYDAKNPNNTVRVVFTALSPVFDQLDDLFKTLSEVVKSDFRSFTTLHLKMPKTWEACETLEFQIESPYTATSNKEYTVTPKQTLDATQTVEMLSKFVKEKTSATTPTVLHVTCKTCERTSTNPDENFCSECGTQIRRFGCSRCKNTDVATRGEKFCPSCGLKLPKCVSLEGISLENVKTALDDIKKNAPPPVPPGLRWEELVLQCVTEFNLPPELVEESNRRDVAFIGRTYTEMLASIVLQCLGSYRGEIWPASRVEFEKVRRHFDKNPETRVTRPLQFWIPTPEPQEYPVTVRLTDDPICRTIWVYAVSFEDLEQKVNAILNTFNDGYPSKRKLSLTQPLNEQHAIASKFATPV